MLSLETMHGAIIVILLFDKEHRTVDYMKYEVWSPAWPLSLY